MRRTSVAKAHCDIGVDQKEPLRDDRARRSSLQRAAKVDNRHVGKIDEALGESPPSVRSRSWASDPGSSAWRFFAGSISEPTAALPP